MSERPLKMAGNGMIWQGLHLFGVKGIFFLRLIVLARLLTPEDFGLMAIAVSAIGFMMSVTEFGMIPALVQGKEVDEQQYNIAWTIHISRAFLVSLIVFSSAPLLANIFSEPRSINLLRVLALRPIIDALASIKIAGLTRNLHFRPLTILGLLRAVTNTVVAVAMAPLYGVWALIIGVLAGSLIYAILSYLVAPHWPRLSFDSHAARPLIRFGQWIFVTSLVVLISSNLLRIVIARQLGAAELGLYYLAAQIAFLPYEIANEVIAAVVFPLYARLQTSAKAAAQTFRTIYTGTAALLFPVCALIIALSPSLVAQVLGPEWSDTVLIIRLLTLATVVSLFGEAAVPIFKGLGQPYRETTIETVQSVVLIIVVLGLTSRLGLTGAAIAWLPAITAAQLLSAIFLKRILKSPFSGLGMPITAIAFASMTGAVIARGIDSLGFGLVGLVLAVLLAIAVTGLLLLTLDKRFQLGFARNLTLFFPQLNAIFKLPPLEQESFSI